MNAVAATRTSEAEAIEVSCNLCGQDDTNPWGAPKDSFRLVKCRNCGLIYVNPRPSPKVLNEFYRKEYFDDGDYAASKQREKMYEIEIARMLPIVGARGRFLDVGCAMGKFLNTLPDTFEKHGVEFSEDAARYGREVFGLQVLVGQLSEVAINKDYYDIVQMRGVIEHLQDPMREVRCVNSALRMSGWFVLNQTPNVGGLSAWFYKELFNQVKPREHLYYFTIATMRRLLEQLGFAIRYIWFPYWRTPYATPSRDFINFILNRVKGLESPPFPGNMMAIYCQKTRSV
jgi:SAM-dependent methyltransferase